MSNQTICWQESLHAVIDAMENGVLTVCRTFASFNIIIKAIFSIIIWPLILKLPEVYNWILQFSSDTTTKLLTFFALTQSRNLPFIFLFVFRYLRLIVHIIAFSLYKHTPIPAHPTYNPTDCTVIIPTIDPENSDFLECLASVLANNPGKIHIVTVGTEKLAQARTIAARYGNNISVTATEQANKRGQVCHAVPHVRTRITVLVDDHVFWPSTDYLRCILAPFEDPRVATVGTKKRVRRDKHGFTFAAFWNLIGALYLERHNFELAATSSIDGGVFVISGRTSAHRTSILQDPAFIAGFTNERFFFGRFGPLNADDDNFITRWEVSRGWKIVFQYSDEVMIETTLGDYPKFLSQCLRWARTTWRSNSASLFTDRTVWRSQPWCVYAVYITSFFNFALFMDAALVYTLSKSTFGDAFALKCLAAWIFASKLVKPFPHFWRRPQDLVFLPGYIMFGYFHSLIKLYAGFTFWNINWGGRNLAALNRDEPSENATLMGDEDLGQHYPNPPTTPLSLPIRDVRTPRGLNPVRNSYPLAIIPANVLESQTPTRRTMVFRQRAGRSGALAPIVVDGDEDEEVSGPPRPRRSYLRAPYARNWARSENCERLHAEGTRLRRERCILGDVSKIGLRK